MLASVMLVKCFLFCCNVLQYSLTLVNFTGQVILFATENVQNES